MTTSLFAAILVACLLPSRLSSQVVPLGPEFRVNTYTTNVQFFPAVAAASNGDFVVVWASESPDYSSSWDIFGQRYASGGSTLGTEFQVNTYTTHVQFFPAVAAASNGDFVVVWRSEEQDGSNAGVFGQRYASSGSTLGTEFQVNSYTTNHQDSPAVAAASNGDFVVVWANQVAFPLGHILGQRYASGGTTLGTEFQVDTYTTGFQLTPAIAAASNGDFIVVWGSFELVGQRYASNGSTLGTDFQVNTYTTGSQRSPAIAAASNGDFIVVWESYGQDGSLGGVFGHRYASSGDTLGIEFQINTYTMYPQSHAAVGASMNGDFLVVWAGVPDDGYSSGVFGQRYASNGSKLGTEFQVNTYSTDRQTYPAVAAASNGNFVVVWQSYGAQDGSSYGVFGQRYGVAQCAATPLASCATPGKSVLLIKDKSPAGASAEDKLIWKWLKGPATTQGDFGDPTMTASYRFFCIYTGTAQTLTMEAVVPPVNNWEEFGDKGYKYKDKAASIAGITQILLKGGSSAKILVKGKDGNLDLTPSTLPLDGVTDVMVQLSNTVNSNCWQASFPTASVKKNTDAQFKAKTP